jgi:predicted CXXCH cytochrome family protein
MSRVKYILFSLAILSLIGTPYAFADQCYECHQLWEEGDEAPSVRFKHDVHFQAGLGCSDCHGGNPELDDMDEVRASKGYKGVPTEREIPEFCGSCHSDPTYMIKFNPSLPTDQLEKYRTSIHGERLLGKGDTKVANCVSCHSVHNIRSPQVPASTVYPMNIPSTCAACHADKDYMSGYHIPTDQYSDYIKSVHGVALLEKKDVSAPACNDCHGNHGATPPGVTSISAVCGTCHVLESERFSHSPHKEAFDAADIPECEFCHSNHLVKKPQLYWVGTSDSALCVQCHSEGEPGLETAAGIHEALASMNQAYDTASALIERADNMGMMVTDLKFQLKDVNQAVIKSRAMIHTFNVDSVKAVVEPGLETARQTEDAALGKIDDYYFRRKGLGVATLIITILAVGLFLKIRSMEKRKAGEGRLSR